MCSYKQQHQKFIQHAAQQIAILESQKHNIVDKPQHQQPHQPPPQRLSHGPPPHANILSPAMPNNAMEPSHPPPSIQQQQHSQIPHINPNNPFANNGNLNGAARGPMQNHPQQQQPPPQNMPAMHLPPNAQPNPSDFSNNTNIDLGSYQNPEPPESMFQANIVAPNQPPMQQQQQQQQPPPNQPQSNNASGASNFALPPPNFLIPDLSKPPPGFTNPPLPEIVLVVPEEVKPVAPYYELPAGLIVPLIRLEDYEYRPLDPDELRLPPPAPPSERLLSAVEVFYAPPRHDRPRDG